MLLKKDQKQKEAGKIVKPALPTNLKATPQWMKLIANIILFLSALWAAFSPSLTEIPQEILMSINKYLLISAGVIRFTIQWFKWDYPEK